MTQIRQMRVFGISLLLSSFLVRGESPIHVGALNLDFVGGWGVGDVGGSIVSLPDFNNFRVNGGGNANGGLGLGVLLHPRLMFIGEIGLLNGQHKFQDLGGGYTAKTYTRAAAYDVGLEYLLKKDPSSCEHVNPKKTTETVFRCLVPFVGAGVSTVQNRANVLIEFASSGQVPVGGLYTGASSVRLHQATFAATGQVGARYFVSHRFGFIVSVKAYFPSGLVKEPFSRISGGIFVQLR